MKFDIIREVNKVYNEQNPSTFLKNYKQLNELLESRKNLLLKLKLPPKLFLNTDLIELGSGSGQNTIVFDHLGAKCTLVEYDKKSFLNSKRLFKEYSKNKYNIINKDLFNLNIKKKFDFVISNGVAHHTKNPKKNLELCCKLLKDKGFFILGICLKSGWFQRNLQRAILFSTSSSEEEIIKNSKILFKENLLRSKKYGGRTDLQIIYDTYVNPRIKAVEIEDIIKIFKKNKITIYSTYNNLKSLGNFLKADYIQHRQFNLIPPKSKKDSILSKFQEFSLSNNKFSNNDFLKKINDLNFLLDKVTNQFNDILPHKKINFSKKNLYQYKKKLIKINKIDIFDKEHNLIFLNEVMRILDILSKKQHKEKKLNKIKGFLKTNKVLFKKNNGVGLNYFVGYKNL